MKDLRDWYRYLEVIARDPAQGSPARSISPERPVPGTGLSAPRSAAPAVVSPVAPVRGRNAGRGRSPRKIQPVLKQETLPMELGGAVPMRKKGGRRPLTETREEIIRRLMDPVLTLHEAAAILNLSKATVRRYTEQGKLACQRTAGGQRRFRLSDVMTLVEATTAAPLARPSREPARISMASVARAQAGR